jgi:tetratricopeptide (TPR) repeat protein
MPIIDLTTLMMIAGLFFGAVIGEATLFGDPVRVEITVPPKLVEVGFTEAVAEHLFLSEAVRVGRDLSVIGTPGVQVSGSGSLFAAMARPLALDQAVVALQNRAGFAVVSVDGAIVDKTGGGLEMVIFVTWPDATLTKIKLAQPDGNAAALVERGSLAVLEEVSPYRVALAAFSDALDADASPTEAKTMADHAVARPWAASHANELVMLYNLLGLIALVDGDLAGAKAQFDLSDAVPRAYPAAIGTIALNRAFVAVAQKQPDEALAYYNAGLKESADVEIYDGKIDTLAGLVAWSRGDTERAERLFRIASEVAPDDEAPHAYLAQLLAAKGDATGAAAESSAAASRRRFETAIPALAVSVFWVDPVKGGLKRRK